MATKKKTKKSKLSGFEVCWAIVTDENIQTTKSRSDIDIMKGFRRFFEEAFECETNMQYVRFFDKLRVRTDISDDDRWELEIYEDDFHLLVNLRDNLRKSGVIE